MAAGFLSAKGEGVMGFHPSAMPDRLCSFETMTSRSMHTEEKVLEIAESCAISLLRYGEDTGNDDQARQIVAELHAAAKSDKSKLKCAINVRHLALNIYSREVSIGKLYSAVNARLRRVKCIEQRRDIVALTKAVREACGDLADFALLVWEGLNLMPRRTPKPPVRFITLFRGAELSAAARSSRPRRWRRIGRASAASSRGAPSLA
jgi:hypothetical protein